MFEAIGSLFMLLVEGLAALIELALLSIVSTWSDERPERQGKLRYKVIATLIMVLVLVLFFFIIGLSFSSSSKEATVEAEKPEEESVLEIKVKGFEFKIKKGGESK